MHAFGRSFGLEKTTAPFLFYFSFLFFLIKIIRWVFRPWYDFVSLTPKHKTLFVLLGWDIFMLWDANSCWKQLNIQLCQNHVLHIYNSCNVEPIRVKASGPMWLRVCLFFLGGQLCFCLMSCHDNEKLRSLNFSLTAMHASTFVLLSLLPSEKYMYYFVIFDK